MSYKITDRDRGLKKLLETMRRMKRKGPVVLVGVFGDTKPRAGKPGDPVTNVAIAQWHEFGTTTIPERSFIRSTIDKRRVELGQFCAALGGRVVDGHVTPAAALEAIGLKASSMMRDTIRARIPPPLADATLLRKGGKHVPLIDTGALLNAITYKVVGAQ